VKHRTLGIHLYCSYACCSRTATPEGAAGRPSVSGGRSAQPGVHSRAQQGGAGSSQQQPGPYERRASPVATGITTTRFSRIRINYQTMGIRRLGRRSATLRHGRARSRAPLTLSILATQTMEGCSPSGTSNLVPRPAFEHRVLGPNVRVGSDPPPALYVLWLQRQRDQRLQVTVDLVLQLTNSRNFARYHNLRVIKIHNELVERLNDQYERELRENADAPREISSATLPALSPLAPSGQPTDTTPEQQMEAPDSEQPQEVSSIPSLAAAKPI